MEIVKRKSNFFEFRVKSPFGWGGYTTEIGQLLQMDDVRSLQLIKTGKVEPVLPDPVECVALVDLRLPGCTEAHTAKKFDRVLLRPAQAIELMLQRRVLPLDEDVWRPFGMKLKKNVIRQGR